MTREAEPQTLKHWFPASLAAKFCPASGGAVALTEES